MPLHMVINRHSPDDCAFRDDTSREALMSGLDSLSVTASEQGASVEGIWLNMAAHTIFILIDAPDAHSVDRAIREPWRMAAVYLARAYGESFLELDIPFVRGGRGLALRAGRATFAQALRSFGALAGVGALEYAWHARHFTPEHAGVVLGWYLGFGAIFAAFPFVFRARFASATAPRQRPR